jgi:class 3 adenylate cyclase/tetratricopeptide (TPR) repeat protein
MRCSKCGSDNREGRKFCTSCGIPPVAACPKCSAPIQPDESFCGECGASLSATNIALQAPAAETAPDLPLITERTVPSTTVEGERKTVTALFADLKGSTELMRDVDPEVAQAIIDPALKIMVEAVRYYDGYVVQSTGDGIFALFGVPLAHEDHPQRSLYAALRMQEGLRSYAERLSMVSKPAVVARVGINSGEVVMRAVETGGRVEYTPVGYVTNLASRMQTAAPAGGIAISEETRRLVEGYVELRALGLTELKGVAEPIEVYQVIGLGPLRTHFEVSTRRGLTKFVGREHELAQMRRALEHAMGGHGQVVAIVAEAGAGKSRLVYEFKALLPSGCKLLEAYSASYGKASAWLPVLELLRDYFGIETADDAATRREKVRTALAALDPGLSDTLPYLWGLLGIQEMPDPLAQMDPQIRQRRTRDAVKRIIVREGLAQPTVVIFEDLHWIDGETQALIDLVADSIGNARVLLLVNYRPEYRHQWANKSYYSQLRLDALRRESAGEILAALLGESAELDALKHLIIDRTQGNPFFIEEMVQALFDEGTLTRNGTMKMTRPLGQLRMPPTVQGILAARIDRLPAAEKDLLQTLAVVGRQAPLTVIIEIVAGSQIEQMLGNLQKGEFIYEQAVSGPAVVYEFKHALTQDVAYNSLLIERRKVLHERVGAALEEIYAKQLDDHLPELAHHFSRSTNVAKAIDYLVRAGEQALAQSAYQEAIGMLSAAADLLMTLHETPERASREIRLRTVLRQTVAASRGSFSPEIAPIESRMRELIRHVTDPMALFTGTFGLWSAEFAQGNLANCEELAQRLLRMTPDDASDIRRPSAYSVLGNSQLLRGRVVEACENLAHAAELFDLDADTFLQNSVAPMVPNRSILSWALWMAGWPDQARRRISEATELAKRLGRPFGIVLALQYAVMLSGLLRDVTVLKSQVRNLYSLATESGFPAFAATAAISMGLVLVEEGEVDRGYAMMREALHQLKQQAPKITYHIGLVGYAAACLAARKAADGLRALDLAYELVEKCGARMQEPEIYRVRGELMLLNGSDSAAEEQFRTAMRIAETTQARSWELRATLSLAQLLTKQGRCEEACSMLGNIYNWFTEGFDTADLKEAKALLDELTALNT